MVDSPEHGHRHRSARRTLYLGSTQAAAVPHRRPESFLLQRLVADVRNAERADPRPERRLSVQRAHGAAPAADPGDSASAPCRHARLDAASRFVTPWDPACCAIPYASQNRVRRLQSHDRVLASAAVL